MLALNTSLLRLSLFEHNEHIILKLTSLPVFDWLGIFDRRIKICYSNNPKYLPTRKGSRVSATEGKIGGFLKEKIDILQSMQLKYFKRKG